MVRRGAVSLLAGGIPVVYQEDGTTMDTSCAPRPCLHPIRTLGGIVTTDVHPADHPHHMGLSLAVPDVDGVQYWGGMSYVPGSGYQWLDNEGSQAITAQRLLPDGVDEDIEWHRPDGSLQVRESRHLRLWTVSKSSYTLSWQSTLTSQSAWSIGSPATNGRAGAEYGGVMWRFPAWPDARVLVEEGEGESAAHGSTSRWLAVSTQEGDASVVLVQGNTRLPWFVRTDEYLGACPALAWRERRDIPADMPFVVGLEALVNDGSVTTPHAVEQALSRAGMRGDEQ